VLRADGAPPAARLRPRAPHRFRGEGPLHEVTATRVEAAGGHWHLVTYGLSELEAKESDDPAVSGWGFELTLRLPGAEELPYWGVDLLTNLAAYVWTSRHGFAPGHHLDLEGPIVVGSQSRVRAGVVVVDPGLGVMRGPFGAVEFLQLVGLTADELELCRAWSTEGVVELLARRNPLLVTDPERDSLLADPAVAAEAARRAGRAGSSLTELRVASLRWRTRRGQATVQLGAGAAAALGPALRRELVAEGARFSVVGDGVELLFVSAGSAGWGSEGTTLTVEVPDDEVAGLSALFDGRTGWGRRPAWPGLRWRVVE